MLQTSMVSSLQNVGGFGGKADTLNRYNQYVGDPGFLAQDMARYNAVTPAGVQALAQKLLDPKARAVVITEPK
jgi:zinc protease